MKRAVVGRAVAEEAEDDLPLAPHLAGEPGARADGDVAADDSRRAEVARAHVGDVHRAALALAIAGGLAAELGEHVFQLAAARDAVAVAAVGAGDDVVRPDRRARADRDGLLAGVNVGRALQDVAPQELEDLLLERADHHHATEVRLPLGSLRLRILFRFAGHRQSLNPVPCVVPTHGELQLIP